MRAVAKLVFVACLSYAGTAAAQNAERGVAQSLFEEGVRLMRAKNYAEACPKLAESHRLDPAGGTVFNLASCLEQDGKLASAFVAYDEALSRAKKDGNKKRADVAEKRMAEIRPRISRVTITVAKSDDAKPDVRFDGTPIAEQAWGLAFYADVGTHTITAEAPGHKPFRADVRLDANDQHFVNVPILLVDPSAAAPPPPVVPPPTDAHPPPKEAPPPPPAPERGPLPWILVGTGAALIGAGAITGVLAFSKHSDSNRECPDGACTSAGVSDEHQANTFAWVSDITIPLGVIAAAAGTWLLIRKPAPTTAGAHVAPTTSGVIVYGAF
ncbi:MAG TPA: hypothetical protein VIF62_20340 [Labilithrix sp.]